ncbi:MAG: MCP four helix bundle domain-containing protein [Candidatus Omnitrophica bacterium]|nr:MCP four helix bundle domain-containing protein [Candidatus Omnitrophota bacterium]
MKRKTIDLRLSAGFASLLIFIAVIGGIGIVQIQNLSGTVDKLGSKYLPMQKSILAMRANNGVYAMEIRNYIFWQSSRYLEAASAAADLATIKNVADNFDENLAVYRALAHKEDQKQWADRVAVSQAELRTLGDLIIGIADKMEKEEVEKEALQDMLNRKLMSFESSIHKINDFLENILEKDSMVLIKSQIVKAEIMKRQALTFLSVAMIIVLFIGSQTAIFVYHDRQRAQQRREQLVKKMIKVEEEEKRNLSLQVHDQMGQDLSGLKIYLDLINKGLKDKDKGVKDNIVAAEKILAQLMEKGHNIAEFLMPPALDEIGLVDTVESLIMQYRQMVEIEIDYQKPDHDIKVSGEDALFLYRVVQEGLTNIVKHAKAVKISIKLTATNHENILMIKDNGKGFDYKEFLEGHIKQHKLGLMGLEERAELLSGKITIKTRIGKGTTLIAQLPTMKG